MHYFLASQEKKMIGVYRVNRDGSITWIAEIDDEGRKDLSKKHQRTWKKIK